MYNYMKFEIKDLHCNKGQIGNEHDQRASKFHSAQQDKMFTKFKFGLNVNSQYNYDGNLKFKASICNVNKEQLEINM